MEKKQSSIEWLATHILDNWNDIQAGARNIEEFIEQAKAMHKEEVKESYRQGRSDQQSSRNVCFYHRNAESYFNETFGGDNE